MTPRDWLRIFVGQARALRRREALATTWLRLAEQCRTEAANCLAGARQAAELAAQAARQYARLAPPQTDEFERAVSGLLSELDERDRELESAPMLVRSEPSDAAKSCAATGA